jgi:hypothetical protein
MLALDYKANIKGQWRSFFSAMLTVTNSHGDFRVLALVAMKSHAECESALVKMHNSLEMYGHDPLH